MKKGCLLIAYIVFCTALSVKADIIGMKTEIPAGEKISMVLNPGVEASITWDNGRVEEVVFDGTPMEITVKSDTFTIKSQQSITDLCLPGCRLVSLNPEGAGDNLQRLYCQNNLLTSLDLRKNTALQELNCEGNRLSSLNVEPCVAITLLNCALNDLASLDLGMLSDIKTLVCAGNDIDELDLARLTGIEQLWCQSNKLSELSLSGYAKLHGVFAFSNGLQEVSFSGTPGLKEIWLDRNNLTTLDLSGVPDLEILSINNNNLIAVKLNGSNKSALKRFYAHYNSLFFNSFPTIYNKIDGKYTMKAVLSVQDPYMTLDKVEINKPADFAPFFAANAWGVKHNTVPVWKTTDGSVLVNSVDYTTGINNVYTFHKALDGVYAEVTLPEYPDVTLKTSSFIVYNGADGIQPVESRDNLNIVATGGALQVVTEIPQNVSIYSVSGVAVDNRIVDGLYDWNLPSGIYLVNGIKVVIP